MVVGQTGNSHVFLKQRHLLLKMLKQLNKFFWLNVISSYFEYCQRRIAIPALMNEKVCFFVFVDDWDLMAD